jgi:flagellar hook-associated protein 3 FlgL
MPILPVSTSRTSTPLSNQRLLHQLNNDQLELQRQYDQLSTGQRVLRLSDDPAAAGRAVALHRGIDRSEQLVRNTNSTANFYQGADSALERVDNALIQARASAVEGAQGVISDDERAAIATSIQESINAVFAAGNSVFRDHQLLGGFLDTGSAFAFDGKDILFQGTDAVARTKVGAGIPTAINVNASESIGAFATFLEGDPLNAALDENSRLVDLRRGQGVTPGVIQISGGGNFVDVDLTSASTIGDVASLISEVELDGRPITASLTSDGIRIEYVDGLAGTLAITDSVGSTTASELSISNPAGLIAPPIIGDNLSPRVTKGTKLTDLNDGAGLSLGSGIRIDQGDRSFTVNFDDAETLGDVMIAINRSDADVKAELNEADGRLVLRSLRSGVDYSIGENGGDDARSLGIRSATEETPLSDLNRGRGLRLNLDAPDLTIVRPDGVELDLELEDAGTIEDVIELIRNHPQNQDSRRVLVDLNDVGNGLQLKAPPDANPLLIRQNGTSDAGIQLGLIPPGQSEVTGGIVGSVDTIVGRDYVPRDAGGSLDTLLRLQQAVLDGDIPEIGRLQAKIDGDLDQASRTRGRVGVWSRNLEALRETAEGDVIAMRSQLSNEIDADLTTVISELNQRQVALEASLRVIGQTAQLTVLNYL